MRKKRITALLLGMAMIATVLAGCGSEQKESTEIQESKQETPKSEVNDTPEADTPEAEEPDPWKYHDETIVIHNVRQYTSGIETVFEEDESQEHNRWHEAYKEVFNIELVTDWVSEEYNTKLNLSISTGELPDFFLCDQQQFDELVAADMLYDISEVFEGYASEALKKLRSENENYYEVASGENGELWGVPRLSTGDYPLTPVLWIRDDWKKELGFTGDPQTMDDVIEIARAFMEEKGAAYGIAETGGLPAMFNAASAWQAYPKMWVEAADGSIVYGGTQSEMKALLSAWHKFYEEGIISPNFLTDDPTQDAANGLVGIEFENPGWAWSYGSPQVNGQGIDAISCAYPIPSATGEDVHAPIKYGNLGYIVVSKDCEHPEAVLQIINYYYQMRYECFNDPASIDWDKRAYLMQMEHANAAQVIDPNGDLGSYRAMSETSATLEEPKEDDPFYTFRMRVLNFLVNKDLADYAIYAQRGSGEYSGFGAVEKTFANADPLYDKYWGAPPEELSEYGSTLDDILLQGYLKIVIGEEDISYFDQVVSDWNSAGGERVTKAMNEAFGK